MQLMREVGLLSLVFTCSLSALVFPEQSRERREEEVEPILPCPDGQLYCDSTPDYPTNINILDSVVASRLIKNAIFDTKPKLVEETQLRTSFIKESRACDSRKGTVYPKKAKNIEGKFVFIVNDEQYRQSVEIEQCLGEGEVCLTDSDAPLPTTVCRQKFATYRMYVINQEGRQVYDSFSLPSACICHHKSDLAIKNGFNSDLSLQLTCPPQEELALPAPAPEVPATVRPGPKRRPTRKSAGAIRFGDKRRKRQAESPRECNNGASSYCEEKDTESYPDEIVLEALASTKEINPQLISQLFDSSCKDLKTRFFDIDEEQVCLGIPKIIFPRQARNLRDEWRYIVNIENYTQSVEIEECFNPDLPDEDYETSNGTDSSVQFESEARVEEFGSCLYSGSPGNNPDLTVCRQLSTTHKLLALSTDGQLVVDSFQLPSACACYYREDFLLTFRSGMNGTAEEEMDQPEVDVEVDQSDRISFN